MFGDRLKGLREERQLSQRAVADKLGVTQQAVAKWEAGKAEPDIATINKLADLFGVSVNLLLGRTDPPVPAKANDRLDIVEPYIAEGLKQLSPEAKKEVLEFIEYVKFKYGKKEGDDSN